MKLLVILTLISSSYALADAPDHGVQGFFDFAERAKCIAEVIQTKVLGEGILALRKNLTEALKNQPPFDEVSKQTESFNGALESISTSVSQWMNGTMSSVRFSTKIPGLTYDAVKATSQASSLKSSVDRISTTVKAILSCVKSIQDIISSIPDEMAKC